MLFAHLKRILRMGRLRLRGPAGAQFEFTLAAIAQNLRRLAKLAVSPRRHCCPACCVASRCVSRVKRRCRARRRRQKPAGASSERARFLRKSAPR